MTESLTVLKLIHDLKSPLGALKILESVGEMQPEHRRILELTRSFLEGLVAAAGEKVEQELYAAQVREVARQVVVEKQFLYPDVEIDLSLKIEKFPLGAVSGSAIDLKRVLSNLLDNALAATRSAGSRTVSIQITLSDDAMIVEIEDSAGGYKKKPGKGGWGLGLRIVKDICFANQWQFRLYPSLDGGTTAHLRMPVGRSKRSRSASAVKVF